MTLRTFSPIAVGTEAKLTSQTMSPAVSRKCVIDRVIHSEQPSFLLSPIDGDPCLPLVNFSPRPPRWPVASCSTNRLELLTPR